MSDTLNDQMQEMLHSVEVHHGMQVKLAIAAVCDLMTLHYNILLYGVTLPEPYKLQPETYKRSTDKFNLALSQLVTQATPSLSDVKRVEVLKIASQIIVLQTIPGSKIPRPTL